jgi:hypothetical protein
MAKEYTWEILSLYTAPSKDGKTDVVEKVNWRFQVTEGQYYGDTYEQTVLDAPAPDADYTAYDDLTEETIISWIKSQRDYDELVALVDSRLESNKAPTVVEKIVPWEYPIETTGQEEYIMVIDDDTSDVNNVIGPIRWSSPTFNQALTERSIDVQVPDNMIILRKGLIPVNAPLVVNDRVKIWRVAEEQVNPDYDYFLQEKHDRTWDISNGSQAVATWEVTDFSLDEVKQSGIENNNRNYSF